MVQAGEQGKIPFLIIRRKVEHVSKRRPAVICMHSTGRSKESMRPFLEVNSLFSTLISISGIPRITFFASS